MASSDPLPKTGRPPVRLPMTWSNETARDIRQDQYLTFDCDQFSRGAKAARPMSRRWVSVEQCRCTRDEHKICDPGRRYSFYFYETSDDEEAKNREELSENH